MEPVQGSACASDHTGQGSSDKDIQNQAPVPVPGARGSPEGKDRAGESGSGSLAKITGSQPAFSNSFTKAPFLANSVLCVSCALANSFIQQIFIKHLLSRDPLVGVWDTKAKKKMVPKTWHSVFTK